MRYFLFSLCLLAAVFFSFQYIAQQKNAVVLIGQKVSYETQVMETRQELAKGLMFVKEMPRNKGMLFDFHGYKNVAMWMKNTYTPLDMLFIDCTHKIVDMFENAKPLSLDIIRPKGEVCYVLEINGGEIKAHDIHIGDSVTIK